MKASKTVLDNAEEIMKKKNFNVTLNVTLETGKALKEMLEKDGKLDDEALDWICQTLPYFPESFLRKDAVYYIDFEEEVAKLWFTILIFSPLTMIATLMKIDEISGGFEISKKTPEENGLEALDGEEDEGIFDE